MIRRLVRGLLAGIGILLLAATAAFLVLCWQINRTGSSDQAQPADAIVTLGARVGPDGQPGPDLRVRTLHAVSLYQQGLAPYVVCTGGYRDDRLSAAAVACRLAVCFVDSAAPSLACSANSLALSSSPRMLSKRVCQLSKCLCSTLRFKSVSWSPCFKVAAVRSR